MIKKLPFLQLLLIACCVCGFMPVKKTKVLVMAKTNGFHHASIPAGIAAIQKLGKENGFEVDTTTDSTSFTNANLKKYAAVIFLNTTGTILGEKEKEALKNYMHSGGGFVGVHAASDTEYDWPWYNKMVGAWFTSHPKQQVAKLVIKDSTHIATRYLPEIWERKDEWYNFRDINPDIQVLITIDEKSYEGGKNGDDHPMVWYHGFEGGRVFYTALGHGDESYSDPLFLQHLLGGIQYAMGKK
ncbi:MAG: ThuA domain-containing protein [Niabella sp.]